MLKIRPLGTRELKQVLRLLLQNSRTKTLEELAPEATVPDDFTLSALRTFRQLYVPLHRLSLYLPPSWQFVPGLFVATNNHHVLGLIGLSQDGSHNNRWKIDQLIIDPNESLYDVGSQLVNFAVNRYGADGVETFLALADNRDDQALGVLKQCGFRHPTRLLSYTYSTPPSTGSVSPQAEAPAQKLRLAEHEDAPALHTLFNNALPIELRQSLNRSQRDFERPLLQKMVEEVRGEFFRRWVYEASQHSYKRILGCVELSTHNYQDFHMSVLLHPGHADTQLNPLSENLVRWGIFQAQRIDRQARLTCQIYEFQKGLPELLGSLGWSAQPIIDVLVKDYWIPIESPKVQRQSPIVLFAPGRPSPACGPAFFNRF